MIPSFLAVAETPKGDPFALLLFVVLIIAFVVWMLISKKKKKKTAAAVSPISVAVDVPPAAVPVAPGSAGQLKLHNVEPKTAAMLMAIVADKLGKPLNELRFISIKEVEEDEV